MFEEYIGPPTLLIVPFDSIITKDNNRQSMSFIILMLSARSVPIQTSVSTCLSVRGHFCPPSVEK
jgi:hypothetical protein